MVRPAVVVVLLLACACRSREVALLQAAPVGAKVPETASAAELCRALATMPAADRLASLPDGVTVTGVVERVRDFGEDGGIDLWLRCDGPRHLQLGFADEGAELRRQLPALGATLRAHCQLAGGDAAAFYLRGCAIGPLRPQPASPGGG